MSHREEAQRLERINALMLHETFVLFNWPDGGTKRAELWATRRAMNKIVYFEMDEHERASVMDCEMVIE
jgi:hypothetical protein